MSQQNLTGFFLMICTSILYFLLPIANSLTLEMIRRDSFDLNIFPKNLTYAQKSRVFAQLSHSRTRRLQARLVSKSSVNSDIIQPPMKQFMDSAFAVSVDIGSRPYNTYLLVDTGSSVTWVQCEGCKKCFHIKNGPFNQSASTSYKIIRFNHRLCKPQIKSGLNCKFERDYESGYVEGIRALESLHFRSSNHRQRITIPNMLLGCAQAVKNWTFGENVDGPNNVISGIFGLSLGFTKYENSFLELTEDSTKMKFSYCFPSWTASKSKSIPLSFGDDVPHLPPPAMSTPMDDKMYFLNISDISVGGKRLHLLPSVFKRRGNKGGFIIDSGSGETFLVRSAYEKVRRALGTLLESQGKHPDLPHGYSNRFCYKWPLKIKNPQSVTMTYHFENNADLEVHFEDLFMKEKFDGIRKNFACLTISYVQNGETNFLGAAHQANYRFVYDLNPKTLHFKRERC